MATDRPRVQAYIDPVVYDLFLGWKKQREILKESEALNQILKEYFGMEQCENAPVPITEQIEERIEAECSARMQEIKEHVAAKLPTLTELDSKIDGYVQERMAEQSEEWMNQLGEKFYSRIYALEQKVWTLENAAAKSSELPTDSPDELPRELNLTQLAQRLNLSKSVVSRRKAQPDFEEWSKGKDPDEIAWRYDGKKQKFFAVEGEE